MKLHLTEEAWFILAVSAGETMVSGVILVGSLDIRWLLLLPVEFLFLVVLGIWLIGRN